MRFDIVDDNPCNQGVCQNGGECIAKKEDGAFKCECTDGWSGIHCETKGTKRTRCKSIGAKSAENSLS